MKQERMEELFNNLCNHVVESTSNEELLNVLHGIGFTDDEIKECDMEYALADNEDEDYNQYNEGLNKLEDSEYYNNVLGPQIDSLNKKNK